MAGGDEEISLIDALPNLGGNKLVRTPPQMTRKIVALNEDAYKEPLKDSSVNSGCTLF
jgi:hypothetical protein